MSRGRIEATFTGQVQGVGFRYAACRTAAGYDVTGYVRNLPDGKVELVAEGPPKQLTGFLDDLTSRMSGYVENVQRHNSPYRGEFEDFGVRW